MDIEEWSKEASTAVAKRIRDARHANQITQQQLAQRVGVSFQQIQKYETGANRIPITRLLQIARALDVDIRCFFEGIVTSHAVEPPRELELAAQIDSRKSRRERKFRRRFIRGRDK